MRISPAIHLIPRATIAGALLLSVVSTASANAQSASAIATRTAPDLGIFLTDQAGRTLYMYTKDDVGLSNCYDACAAAWPPLMAQGDPSLPTDLPGVVGTTQRNDGGLQLTYNGMPLYYWAKDQKPGDTTGQNVGGVWFVINPSDAPTVSVRSDAELGDMLVDARGMTLYLYTKDQPGVSNCYDACAAAWPPLLTESNPTGSDAVAAGLGTTQRTDGSLQVTYNGMPLYFWAKDQKPGDATGQNVGGVWFVVNP
jgi:predicted lipoprotein with Yx(FWY)xxD motif